MKTMDGSGDFIHWLEPDMSLKIVTCLKDPSDLVRISAVSSSWRHFVIENGLLKKLCLRIFPEISSFTCVTEVRTKPVPSGLDASSDWDRLQMEHRVYSSLSRELLSTLKSEDCISDALFASSTDNYPEESIKNTLVPSDRFTNRASYWSSKGTSDPAAPETLIFKVTSRLCLITEVHVHPFQAYFQFGIPIYSAKAVRFWTGYPKVPLEVESDNGYKLNAQGFSDDQFVWTYTSPEYLMAQVNRLQKFKLPEPVLCIGGILKVELLGRVQTQEMDGLYYICINHVQVIGKALSRAFDIEMTGNDGKWALKHTPENTLNSPGPDSSSESHYNMFRRSVRGWERMIVNTFRETGHLIIEDNDSD